MLTDKSDRNLYPIVQLPSTVLFTSVVSQTSEEGMSLVFSSSRPGGEVLCTT